MAAAPAIPVFTSAVASLVLGGLGREVDTVADMLASEPFDRSIVDRLVAVTEMFNRVESVTHLMSTPAYIQYCHISASFGEAILDAID